MNNELFIEEEKTLTEEEQRRVYELLEDIEQLEKEIDKKQGINAKNKKIKNLKIFGGTLCVVYPYIIAGGLTFGLFSTGISTPHHIDKEHVDIVKVLNSDGETKYMQITNENTSDVIKSYSKWEKNENGIYTRTYKSYKLGDDFDYNAISNIIDDENINLEKVLGKPTREGTEENMNLTDEQLSSNTPYIEAYIFDGKGYNILQYESEKFNRGCTIGFYSFLAFILALTCYFRHSMYDMFEFSRYVERLKERYPDIDIDELIKELESKSSEYKALAKSR